MAFACLHRREEVNLPVGRAMEMWARQRNVNSNNQVGWQRLALPFTRSSEVLPSCTDYWKLFAELTDSVTPGLLITRLGSVAFFSAPQSWGLGSHVLSKCPAELSPALALFFETVPLCGPGWTKTCDPHASAFQVLLPQILSTHNSYRSKVNGVHFIVIHYKMYLSQIHFSKAW